MIHRINVFILSVILTLSQVLIINSANAATVGGWSLTNPVAKGASTVYEATKQVVIDGKDYIKKGVVTITPTASQVAKTLVRGAGAAALGLAVGELIGDGVDWVLDPANNQVVYYKEPSESKNCQTDSCKGQYIWYINTTLTNGQRVFYSAPSQSVAISLYRSYMTSDGYYVQADITITGTRVSDDEVAYTHSSDFTDRNGSRVHLSGTLAFNRVLNPNADPEAEERERKTIPLETVAQQVISDAEGGNTVAQAATTAAAADVVQEAENDEAKARPISAQAESTSSTKPLDQAAAEKAGEAAGTSKPNAETGETDLTLEFPIFCDWVPIVCDAAQVVVITVPATIDAVKEWVKPEEPAPAETKVDIEQSPVPPSESNYLQWNAYCPFTAKSDEISINGETSALSSDLTSWCTMASEIKPFVLLAGALASLMIVSGVGLGRGDD